MVKRGGIPWQSKGCGTCKKRRIKCDQGKPECNRCLKRGIQCLGYERHGVFIHYTAKGPHGKSESTSQVQRVSHRQPATSTSLSPVSSGPMMREKFVSEYIHGYFPTGMAVSDVDMWHYLLQGFAGLPNKTEMLDKTLSAITCFYVGKNSQDDRISKHGLQLYNSAIRHMSSMISREFFSEDIVYTAVLFQEIESSYCPNGLGSWLAHINGLNTIMKHYRPMTSNNPLIGPIYQRYQKLRMIQSSSARGLLPDEYKFLTETTDGTPFCKLLSIFAELSPIVTKLQSTIDTSDYNACRDLLQHCLRTKSRFFSWYTEHHLASGILEGSSSPAEFISSDTPDAERLFGTPCRFLNFDYILLHLHYWAGLCLLYPSIFHAKKLVYTHPLSQGTISPETINNALDPLQNEEYLEASQYADEICRTMRYCTRDHMKIAGYHMTMFPLCAASQIYTNFANLEKFSWCISVVKSAANRGHETAHYIVDISWYTWHLKTKQGPMTSVALREVVPERVSGKEVVPERMSEEKVDPETSQTVTKKASSKNQGAVDVTSGISTST